MSSQLVTIDCHYVMPQLAAAYLRVEDGEAAFIEVNTAHAVPHLLKALADAGLKPEAVKYLIVTHVHLDHSGAAGWLARDSGATVHVHTVGAPHLADPGKLLASAQRIYGEDMDRLWGETVAVPAGQVYALQDGDVIDAAGLRLVAVDTPGHAYHHMAYLLDGQCFTGDVAAVRFPDLPHVRVPTPPPEIDLSAWRRSLARLRELRPDSLLPTHFGPVEVDTYAHLQDVEDRLAAAAAFVRAFWQEGVSTETIIQSFKPWIAEQALADGVDSDAAARFEVIVPSEMCVQGLVRHYQKLAR